MSSLAALLLLCFSTNGLNAQTTPRPNIVLILVDDMGYSDIGCCGSEIPTPNIDRLASEGSRCCPTRAALMTGLHPHQAGVGHMTEDPHSEGRYDDWNNPAFQGYLNRECVTMAEALGQAGYPTYMAGKWHLGYHERDQWPLQAKQEDIAKFEGKYMVGWDSLRQARYEKQLAMELFEEAPGLSPRDDRVRSWDKLRQEEKEGVAYRMAVYAAQLSAVDQNVGRLIDYLEESGELDNTLIIFLSDNGACAGFYDELGSGSDTLINNPIYSAVSYGIGWANLGNTPFR